MSLGLGIVAAVALQRLVELAIASANTRRLRARGAVETGAGHYPLLVLLHAGWLAAMVTLALPGRPLNALPLAGVVALMAARIWVMTSLGHRWTTRILTLPGEPPVRRGPYRWLRHPNYLVVAGEIALLPLVFDGWLVAAAFSAANGALLAHRVAVEDRALETDPAISNST